MMKSKLQTDGNQNDPRWELVLRMAASSQLKGSARLREFLLYVADRTLHNSPDEVTEQQIGIQVFGRQAGFNSSEDSIVRTHARLLRIKMAAYFSSEGAAEPMTIEIPKGHYLPIFVEAAGRRKLEDARPQVVQEFRREAEGGGLEVATLENPVHDAAPERAEAAPMHAPPRWQRRAWMASVALCVALAALVLWLAGARTGEASGPVLALWKPFLTEDAPILIYSNALFQGDSKSGLRYASPDATHNEPLPNGFTDHYTGIGELVSVYELTRLFDRSHASFTLKRSLLVTWDEAKLRNLIFIGAAAENSSMRVLPTAPDFTMMSGEGFAGIVNQHPAAGEPALLTRPEYPLTRDYALIALLPGVEPGRHTLVLSGLTTMGTEAAVEFACRKQNVAELLHAIGYTSGEVRPFEAVLEVTIGGGVPLQSHLVMVRAH